MPEQAPEHHPTLDKRALLRKAALEYHEFPKPGKITIAATKQMVNQHDLALAYSPGVAAPCEEIVKDPKAAFKYTSRGNLVGVVTNGTAVLGLGDIGPLASKPVMEGKAVLFKKFSGIDVFDIEINEQDPEKLVEIIASLEPTFGGINLEDIKAPDCFYVDRSALSAFRQRRHADPLGISSCIPRPPASRSKLPVVVPNLVVFALQVGWIAPAENLHWRLALAGIEQPEIREYIILRRIESKWLPIATAFIAQHLLDVGLKG